MKTCKKCSKEIPTWIVVDDKKVNLQRRKFCFNCSPYKSGNRKDLTIDKSKQDPITKKRKRKTGSADVQKFRHKRKARIIAAMGGECQCCSYDKCIAAMELHHKNPAEKEFGCGNASANPISWEKLVPELRKCVLLCSNCHREVHAGIRVIPESARGFNELWSDYKIAEASIYGGTGQT